VVTVLVVAWLEAAAIVQLMLLEAWVDLEGA
jgi:hypothetical protein